MRVIISVAMACTLLACATTPPPQATANAMRCDALAGERWHPALAPEVAAELLALAHQRVQPAAVRWYRAEDGAYAACLPPQAGADCGHVLHTYQPQVHRMWGWSDSTARREACAPSPPDPR